MKKTLLLQKLHIQSQTVNQLPDFSSKGTKINYLLENSQGFQTKLDKSNLSSLVFMAGDKDLSKDLPLFLSLTEKPINLLFSLDQFIFEFSKSQYQQKKSGEFFQQLKERKKLSLFYGHLTRKQIETLVKKAGKLKGYFSRNLFSLLERRLDVVLYRSGLTQTIHEARQFIKHNKIRVNDARINISSYSVSPGDIISIQSGTQSSLTRQMISLNQVSCKQGIDNSKQVSKVLINYYERFIKLSEKADIFLEKKNKKLKKNFQSKTPVDSSHQLSNQSKANRLEGNPSTELPINRVTYKSKKTELFAEKQGSLKKFLCNLLIQSLLSRIKSRSFFSIFDLFLNKKKSESIQCFNTVKTMEQRYSYLTLLKWKRLSRLDHKTLRQKKFQKKYKNSQGKLYATGGCLEKKPLLWKQTGVSKNKRQIVKFYRAWNQLDSIEKQNRMLIKKLLLMVLRSLSISNKFYNKVALNLKKALYKKSNDRIQFVFSRNLQWRTSKPIHLETSYSLLTTIFLYTPQRINFPFSLDLDLIQRSLR